jgi:AcrR family transcriptional regulator
MATPEGTLEHARRPRDRKAQIAAAAAEQFHEFGYHRVGIEDIAGAVGITGRAIYRHFATKQALLAHILLDAADALAAACDGRVTVPEVVEGLAAVIFDHRPGALLLQRETRYLAPEEQRQVQKRLDLVGAAVVRALLRFRPEISVDQARFLARCTLAVLASPSHHHVTLPRPVAESRLQAMARAVIRAPALPVDSAPPVERPLQRASRREAILAVAVELFGLRGYGAVRMEDVGAAAGITGPSVYEHFDGKAELLMAALTRGAEWLQLGLADALAQGGDGREALERVVRSYVTFTLEHTAMMRVLLRETINLPDDERAALRRVQHEYIAEWVRLLAACRSDLSDAEAWFVTHAGLAVVNDTVERAVQHDLVPVALAVLVGEGE